MHPMIENDGKINELIDKLELLLKRQDEFSNEINALRTEINQLKTSATEALADGQAPIQSSPVSEIPESEETIAVSENPTPQDSVQTPSTSQEQVKPTKRKSDIEKFIGENLISKIGIAILVIGVAIGAKYSIENNLISPLTRIIIGYLFGLGLFGFGIKLKAKYENYSAVLVSGAMSILYFITYFAYGFYQLLPQMMAFTLMLIFTVITVAAAFRYNRQIIAHIGLVGAYAVPFITSNGSGNAAVLFTYMAIINIGILVISFKKYWKPLYYVSFVITWLIVLVWYDTTYQSGDLGAALVSISVFFALFYLTFLAYKLFHKEEFAIQDITLLIVNSFIFYGIGYSVLDDHLTADRYLGLFTLINALVHAIVGVVIYRRGLNDKNIFSLVVGLALVFLTIAIPVQLDGNWVTLLWAGEALTLFWIGRTKHTVFYERLSYMLMLLSFISLIQDWEKFYRLFNSSRIILFANVGFLTSVLYVAIFTFINVLNQKERDTLSVDAPRLIDKIFRFIIPAILIFSVYSTFKYEIAAFWDQLYVKSWEKGIEISLNDEGGNNQDLLSFKNISIINYSILFVSVLFFINFKKIKNKKMGWVIIGLIALAVLVFLTTGLSTLSSLRESYFGKNPYYGIANLWVRYVSFVFVAFALYCVYKHFKEDFVQPKLKMLSDLFIHTAILWIASSELIHWMDIFVVDQSYKLGLSILWGVYSLFLIVLGIWKKNKPIRIGAIALFGVTLFKLFFYDLSHLDTIAKTIVFVSLGVLLLLISFLYTKYKYLMSDNEVNK